MAFPFGAALMALSAGGSLASSFMGGNVQGMGRMQRTLQAQVNAAANAQRYFEASGDVTNPLFRQTAMLEESRLRRSIAEGLQTRQLLSNKARARGLTAGVRSERQDETMSVATGKLFQQASERAGGLASERLQATGRGLLGVADAYQGAMGGAQQLSQMQTAQSVTNAQRWRQGFDILGLAGQAMGGSAQIDRFFQTGGFSGGAAGLQQGNYTPSAWPQAWQQQWNQPQFSWRGGP